MPDVPYGFCHCGCGQRTALARENDPRYDYVKGEPVRFIRGHNVPAVDPETAYEVDPETGCWVWLGDPVARYPRMRVGGRRFKAFHWFWEREHGPIPDGLVLDHTCQNTRCVNPAHMEPVTQTENMRRAKHVKLTMTQAASIRRAEGTTASIARHFGVSDRTVHSIRRGETWQPVSVVREGDRQEGSDG